MSAKKTLSIAENTQEFFYGTLEKAMTSQQLLLSPALLHYLSSILSHYSATENLSREESLHSSLSKKYTQALSSTASSKNILFKQVAEESLYTLGFFTPFFKKKIMGVEYYVSLGAYSYSQLSVLELSKEKKDIFLYCSENFLSFLNLFRSLSKNFIATDPLIIKDKSL